MSCVEKLVSEVQINAPAEKYYKFFKKEIDKVPKICPQFIQKVVVHEGDWSSHGHGSIKIWNYTVDGKAEVYKERVEFDDKNMAVTLVGLEGHVFDVYKSFQGTFKVVPKGPNHCLVVMTLKYEKLYDGCPCPFKYLDLMRGITNSVESHLQ